MDLKKEFFQKNIKQEAESETFSSVSELFPASNNVKIKFEDIPYTNTEPEDDIETTLKAIVEGDQVEERGEVKECETASLTKNLDVELISNRQICRLCAQPITSTEICLYEDGDLMQKILYTLPITIRVEDGLPEFICCNCETNLNTFHQFVCQVVNADKAIRERINPRDIKTDTVIKQIFGSESASDDDTNIGELQDLPVLEEEMGVNQLLEVDANKSYLEVTETNEDEQLLDEADTKHLLDIKNSIIKGNEKKLCKHLSQEDNYFVPKKIQKISILNSLQQRNHSTAVEQHECFDFADNTKETHEGVHYSCPESNCLEYFTTQKSLRQHISDAHNVPVICCKCGKIFAHQAALDKHHNNVHFHQVCDKCGMSFKTSVTFETHKVLHAEVSEFQCTYCYKNFLNKCKLQRHTRQMHSGNFKLMVHRKEQT